MVIKRNFKSKIIALTLLMGMLVSMVPEGMAPILAHTTEHADVFTITVKNTDGVAISGAVLTGKFGSVSVSGITDNTGTLAVPDITKDILDNGIDCELILTVKASGYVEITDQSYGNYGGTAKDEKAHLDIVLTPISIAPNDENEGAEFDTTVFRFKKTDPKQTYSPDFQYSNTAAGGAGNGSVTYAIIAGSGEASIDKKTGVVSNVKKAGTIIIEATKAADNKVKKATANYTLTIEKAEQTGFGFVDPGPIYQPYTSGFKFTNIATGGQTKNTVTYAKAEGIGAVNAGTSEVTVTQAGKVIIRATRSGDAVYKDATTEYELIIEPGDLTTFEFRIPVPGNIKYGMTFYNPAISGETSGSVIYEVTENAALASVDANGTVSWKGVPRDDVVFPIDITVSATRIADSCYTAKTISYTLRIERDPVTTADFTVNGKTIKPVSDWYNAADVSGEKIVVAPRNGYTQISTDGVNWYKNLEFDEGKISTKIYLKKENGAITSFSEERINFDKTAPEHATITVKTFNPWIDFWNAITFNKYASDEQLLHIIPTDNMSGIAKIEYYEDNTGRINYSYKDAERFPYSVYDDDNKPLISFSGLEKKMVVIYARITDVAGNISYFRTEGMKFDALMELSEEPKINITLPSNLDGDPYYEDVPFKVTVTDPDTGKLAQGISYVETRINAPGREEKVITANNKGGKFPSELLFDSSLLESTALYVNQGTYVVEKEFNSKNVTVSVLVRDINGNEYKETVTLAVHTAPEITVTYDNNTFANDKYLGNGLNRKATIEIMDLGFKNSEIILTVKKDGTDLNISPAFYEIPGIMDENGDQLGWSMIIDYAQFGDGEYTFDIGYRNLAKDSIKKVEYDGENPQEFAIDNSKPVIEVTFQDAVSPANTNYYRGVRTATIKVLERNWRSSDFLLYLQAEDNLNGSYESIDVPVLSSWTSIGDEHTATLIFQTDGKYTFSAGYCDLANNYAQSLDEIIFYIDLKDPIVPKTLADINIGNYVNGAGSVVAPQFTVSDNNYDENNVEITLIGAMHGNVALNGIWSQSDDGRGGTYTLPDFEKVKTQDDIYTLNVKVTDKSGRVSESGPLQFSVNRFGSTFDMKAVQSINKGYFKAVQDIVIREINPNKIDPDAYSITLSRNGSIKELVQDNEYKIDSIENAGQWSEYAYTVNASNFINDGRFVVTVKNKDLAENENSSDNIEQIGDLVTFAIDNTSPTVSVSGLEENGIYSGQSQTLTIALTDNIKLKNVSIKLNGETVTGKVLEDIDTSYKVELTIPGAFDRQTLELAFTDAAGNSNSATIKEFLINDNIFIRFFQNRSLFFSSIGAGVAVLIGFAAFLILRKKKRALKQLR